MSGATAAPPGHIPDILTVFVCGMKSEIREVDKTRTYPGIEIYYAIEVPLTHARSPRVERSARFYPTLRRQCGASEIDASISQGGEKLDGGKLWVKGWG